ncbi:hypothetical protein N431DRAFT_481336 [Stipitochalara longipes BDJ]|nr:hypothetical protein N431DRAFT_481336 [Stipitochalara longipes BDJ]
MEPDDMEDDGTESRTLQRIRSDYTQSTDSNGEITHLSMPRSGKKDYLGLIDIASLAKLQLSISGAVGKSTTLGSPSPITTLLLGGGGSFVVRRVSNTAFVHSLSVWDEAFDKSKGFVVVKQPSVKNIEDDNFESRLYDAMMELKVSYHEPLRKHPNIVHMHSFMWDIQSNNADALAPSLIMEYADLGTVSDFQDPKRLTLHSNAKLQISLDVAEEISSFFVIESMININDKHQATAIRAKLGDFGSALIGVLEDSDCPKQKPRGYSPPWNSPEKFEETDTLGLRRRDMYSYGLTIWRIMCNGEMPYSQLFWDSHHENITSEPPITSAKSISLVEFVALKKQGNSILDLAVDTLRNRPRSDVDFEKMQAILKITLCIDPSSRAVTFNEIVSVLRVGGSKINTGPKSEPLKAGDFGITDSKFPHFLYLSRTAPASFRSLICGQLNQYAQESKTKSKRALYHLALGVCHWQNFYSCTGNKEPSNSPDLDFLQAGAVEILKAADLGNPIARSLAPRALAFSKAHHKMDRTVLEEWLVDSMRHGSIRARK